MFVKILNYIYLLKELNEKIDIFKHLEESTDTIINILKEIEITTRK